MNFEQRLKLLEDARKNATPGEWDNRCNEFSNTARPRFIWDSTWGFIGDFNSGSQDVVNAEFVVIAANHIQRLIDDARKMKDALEQISVKRAMIIFAEDEKHVANIMEPVDKVLSELDKE